MFISFRGPWFLSDFDAATVFILNKRLAGTLKALQGTFKHVNVVMCGIFNFMYILWKGLLVLDIPFK